MAAQGTTNLEIPAEVCAKDSQEVMALHADYVKAQVAAFGGQAREITKQAAKLAGESVPL